MYTLYYSHGLQVGLIRSYVFYSKSPVQPCAAMNLTGWQRGWSSSDVVYSLLSRRTTEKADVLFGDAVRRCLLHALGFLGSALRGGDRLVVVEVRRAEEGCATLARVSLRARASIRGFRLVVSFNS